MISANIYAKGGLSNEHLSAVREGLDFVAGHIGESVSDKVVQINIPTGSDGSINPRKVGVGKLPVATDLHVFAMPFRDDGKAVMGLAYALSGVSFVNTRYGRKEAKIITAHEATHALGFVKPGSKQVDINSQMHCCDGGCIMHRWLTNFDGPLSALGVKTKKPYQSGSATREMFGLPQDDYCMPCKQDMYSEGATHLEVLRVLRAGVGILAAQESVAI